MKGRKKCVLQCSDIKKLKRVLFDMTEQSHEEEREYGAMIYQDPRTCRLKFIETCVGEECSIAPKNVEFGNLSFHTHPTSGTASPSHNDIATDAARNRHFCIGSFVAPESDWDDDEPGSPSYVINCWRPPSWAKKFTRWEYDHIYDPRVPQSKRLDRLKSLIAHFYSQTHDQWGEGASFCSMADTLEDRIRRERRRR